MPFFKNTSPTFNVYFAMFIILTSMLLSHHSSDELWIYWCFFYFLPKSMMLHYDVDILRMYLPVCYYFIFFSMYFLILSSTSLHIFWLNSSFSAYFLSCRRF